MRHLSSPDNFGHNAPTQQPCWASLHSALAVGTPKMPGEPPRVQPSRKNPLNWEDS